MACVAWCFRKESLSLFASFTLPYGTHGAFVNSQYIVDAGSYTNLTVSREPSASEYRCTPKQRCVYTSSNRSYSLSVKCTIRVVLMFIDGCWSSINGHKADLVRNQCANLCSCLIQSINPLVFIVSLVRNIVSARISVLLTRYCQTYVVCDTR